VPFSLAAAETPAAPKMRLSIGPVVARPAAPAAPPPTSNAFEEYRQKFTAYMKSRPPAAAKEWLDAAAPKLAAYQQQKEAMMKQWSPEQLALFETAKNAPPTAAHALRTPAPPPTPPIIQRLLARTASAAKMQARQESPSDARDGLVGSASDAAARKKGQDDPIAVSDVDLKRENQNMQNYVKEVPLPERLRSKSAPILSEKFWLSHVQQHNAQQYKRGKAALRGARRRLVLPGHESNGRGRSSSQDYLWQTFRRCCHSRQ